MEIEEHILSRQVELSRNHADHFRAEILQLSGRVDRMRDIEQNFPLPFFDLPFGNIGQKDRQSVFVGINAEIVPLFKTDAGDPVYCRLKGFCAKCQFVFLADLVIFEIREDLEDVLSEHFFPFPGRPFFRRLVPIGDVIIRIKRKKSAGDTFENVAGVEGWVCHEFIRMFWYFDAGCWILDAGY